MNMTPTGRVCVSVFLCFLFLVVARLPFGFLGEVEAADPEPLDATTGSLLNIYRQAAVDDPDGYVQQMKAFGSIELLKAVKLSLEKSLTLNIQEETVNVAKGQYQGQGGLFDYTVSLSGGYGLNSTKLDSVSQAVIPFQVLDNNETTTSLALSKQLRTGPAISLSSQLAQTDYSDGLMARFAGTADPKTTAIVKLEVKIPLLKGAGHFVAAAETAAKYSYESSQFQYVQAILQNTLNVVEKYWDYRTVYSSYDVNLSMESLINLLLKREQDNIGTASAQMTSTDTQIKLSTLHAKLADASRDSSQARQNITSARQSLALALGLGVADLGTLPVPADDFELDDVALKMEETAYLNYLNNMAIQYRPDLKSLNLKIKSTEILVAQAENNLKPSFDLVGSAGYMGLSEDSGVDGFSSSITDTDKGELWSVGFSCSYPFGNQAAKGTLLAQDASRRINVIQRNDLIRQITSQLTVDIGALEQQISSLKQANISVSKYWQAMQASLTPQIVSNAYLVDLLDLQEKLREAELERLTSLNNLAKAIATVRFHTGTLVGLEDEKTTINNENLTSLP
jgi:outer membrane protein TolC